MVILGNSRWHGHGYKNGYQMDGTKLKMKLSKMVGQISVWIFQKTNWKNSRWYRYGYEKANLKEETELLLPGDKKKKQYKKLVYKCHNR